MITNVNISSIFKIFFSFEVIPLVAERKQIVSLALCLANGSPYRDPIFLLSDFIFYKILEHEKLWTKFLVLYSKVTPLSLVSIMFLRLQGWLNTNKLSVQPKCSYYAPYFRGLIVSPHLYQHFVSYHLGISKKIDRAFIYDFLFYTSSHQMNCYLTESHHTGSFFYRFAKPRW